MPRNSDAEYWALYNLGLTDREIAEKMPRHITSVRGWRLKNELPPNKKPAENPPPKETKPKDYMKNRGAFKCKKCVYWKFLSGRDSTKCCHYILITGHARRCPVGEGCTKYTPIRKENT